MKESVSLNPYFLWALTAVIGQMAQSFVIGLPRAACVGNETPIAIMTALETCQYIDKMVWIVPYQFEPESEDETVEVADRQETDSRARLEQDIL